APNFPKGASQEIRLVHTGSLYEDHQDIRPLFEALRLLIAALNEGSPSVRIDFAASKRELAEAGINEYGLNSCVQHYGQSPYDDARQLQASAEILLYFDFKGLSYDGVLPCRLFDYVSTGKEVLFLQESPSSSAADFLKRCG